MYAVAFKSQDNKQLDLSVVGDAGYALILPWMPVPVSMITLTQVVSGTSTVVARAAIGREIPDLKHLALTVDGMQAKVYFRGRLLMVGTLSTTMSIDRIELQGGTKDTLLSEMLLMPRVAEPEDIKTWWNLRAPFYDPSPVIQEDQIPAAETWNQAVHDAQRALADAADAQATADGKVTTFYQDTEPIAEALGDLWVHTGEDNKLYRWSGSSWDVVQDKKIQEAVQKAEDAQATADGKIVTFYQSTPPTATAVGDLWVDTDDNNHLYRWDGTEWVDIQDKSPIPDERIPSAESWSKKNRTYYQDAPPAGTHSLGDVWFDTSDHNRRHWWDGSKWVDAEDVSPIDASQRPVTARGLGGVIEMDHQGMRFIRKADNEITLQMDIETGSAYFKGDITGASGTFADGQVAIGDVSGKPWGSGVLPPGTPGIWGDQAGLYLRGYPKIVAFGNLSDEDVLELPPDVTGNPIMQLSLSQIVVPEIGTTILANYVYNPEARTFKVQSKILALSPPRTLPGNDSRNGYTYTVPSTADEGGIYGRKMNTVTIKAGFSIPSNGTCRLKVYTNCEFGGDGKPVESEWKLQHVFLLDRGVGGGYSGYWPLLTLNLPQVYGEDTRYALRFIDSSKVAFYISRTWVESIEYRETTFYDIEGAEIGPTDPSGIQLSYIVFEQG